MKEYNRPWRESTRIGPWWALAGVVIENGRALLIKRGSEPLLGQWSIPGGTLELGESLQEGVARELLEETGLEVRVLDMIEACLIESFWIPRRRRRRTGHGPSITTSSWTTFASGCPGKHRRAAMVTDIAFATEERIGKVSDDDDGPCGCFIALLPWIVSAATRNNPAR